EAGWLDYPFYPVLSHDGLWLAFGDASTEGGPGYSVMIRRTSGGRAARLGEGFALGFSADGKRLLALVPSASRRVMIYPTGAGTERQVDVGTLEKVAYAEWGPGDSSVLMCGDEKGGRPACYIRP